MAIQLAAGWTASSPDAGFAAAGRQKVSFLATLSAHDEADEAECTRRALE